jgi:DNA-binding NarL/FixJ family response regulator
MLRILLAEDSQQDREILRYLLTEQFKGQVEFYEAQTLFQAMGVLESRTVDCVLLDLQLPDSTGKSTFDSIYKRYPDIPVIVMTNNRDRDLALEVIRAGAADYVTKSYTDNEDTFRRIVFAIEKHQRSIRTPTEGAKYYRRLERASSNLEYAKLHDDAPSTLEVATATANLSQRMFAEIQQISQRLNQYGAQQEVIAKTTTSLEQDLVKGYPGHPSIKTQIELLGQRVTSVEASLKEVKGEVNDVEDTQRREALNIVQVKMTNRTKVIIAVITLLGVAITSTVTYLATTHKPAVLQPHAAPTTS